MTPAMQRVLAQLDGRAGSRLVQLRHTSAVRLEHASGQLVPRVYFRRHVVSQLVAAGELWREPGQEGDVNAYVWTRIRRGGAA
jgi:hypothetical protein